jgi:uncharacterized repeat protein (TIGR01451 family)
LSISWVGYFGLRRGIKEFFGVAKAALNACLQVAPAALLLPMAAWAADPQITSFIDDPDPVPAGGVYSYSLRIDNNSAQASTNTRLSVDFGSGAMFISALPAQANCAQESATRVVCQLGTVGASGLDVRDVQLKMRAIVAGPATINATATVAADNDTNPANNTQGSITTVINGANLRMSKVGTPNPVVGGANVTYTLTATNAGPNAGGAVVLTDNLPPALSFVSASGSGWSCSNAGSVVTCTRPGPHAVNATLPAVTLIARVNASGGTVTNSASIAPADSGGVPDPDSSDNTATVDTTVVVGADVRIAQKTVISALPAIAGSDVTFLIQPRNGGPGAANTAQVSDPLPAGWTYVSAGGPNWNCGNGGNVVQCSRPTLPVGATDDITVVARAPANVLIDPAGATFTNTASISSSTADPDNTNNAGSVNVTVLRDGADLRLAKVKTPNPVALGFNMVSDIIVTNNGPRIATGPLRVVERLSGETYVAPPAGAGWTCDGSAPPVVVCTHANAGGLAVGGSLPTLQITTQATTAGVVSNTACTGSSVPAGVSAALASPPLETDGNNTNDCATTSSTSTTVRPDLAITKQTTTPTGADNRVSITEGSVTYTLVVSNVSATPQAATGVVITDDVPAYVSGATTFGAITATASGASTAVFACGTSEARVTCTQTGGQLLQGASVTVSIPVNRPLQDGSYTNTAAVRNTAEGDPDASNNQASSNVIIDPIADVEMTGKSVTPTSVRAGEVATYVLSYRNNGPSIAQGVTVSDTFNFAGGDSGLTVTQIDSSAPGSTCSIAAGALITPAQPAFTCTIGNLARGETQTITLRARPNFLAPNASRSFSNLARVNTTTPESPSGGDNGNNEQTATLAVTPAAVDLLVNKTDRVGSLNLDPVGFNGSAFLGYQVSVTNNGPSFATNVRVAENMTPPANRRIRFVCDVTAFGGSTCNPVPLCSVSNVTSLAGQAIPAFNCSVPSGSAASGAAIGELAVGSTKNIWLRFEALDTPTPTGDVYNNVATVSANEPDTQPGNDSEGEQTTTRLRVSFTVTKTASIANPALMQPFNWIVNVGNAGPGNSLQTDITDQLPAGVESIGTATWTRTLQAASGVCSVTNSSVLCPIGQLDSTGSAIITIPVRVASYPVGGTITNSASVDTDPVKTGGIDTPGGSSTGSGAVTVQRSSLAGVVFSDTDRSGSNGGTPQAGDSRIAGVVLTLNGTDLYGNPLSRTTTTDVNGDYLFNDLPPSNAAGYTVTETQPEFFTNGPVDPPVAGPNAPSIAGAAYSRGGALGNSSYAGIVLPVNVNGTQFNFPELRSGSLAGFVYVDTNNSGTREPAIDTPIAGATVRLLNAATGAVVATTTTDANGAYRFPNLDSQTRYTLEEPLPVTPASLANSAATAGLVGGNPCAGCTVQANSPSANTDRIANIDLSTGFDGVDFNFGEVQGSFISGLVWLDSNRNNTLDASESVRLSGIVVRLVQGADCVSGSTLQTATTAADGAYRFDGLRAQQNYLVCQTQPAGYGIGSANGAAGSNTITVLNLPFGGSTGNNFGETLSSLAGAVYLDTGTGAGQTNNGARDSGEAGLAGVPVTLLGRDINGSAVSLSTTTDASGNYRFDGLLQSDASGYVVTEGAIPAALGVFADGRDTAGSAGGSNAVNDSISGIVLGAGIDATGYLFGELVNGSISGTVYADYSAAAPANTNNGQRDGGEVGIAGVPITLSGRDASGAAVTRSTTTDANGNYRFDDLQPSDSAGYTISEGAIPAASGRYNDGRETVGSIGGGSAVNDVISGIVLARATQATGYNFGELPVAPITGTVYLDGDRDGTLGAADSRIPGVVIRLVLGTDCGGTVVGNTTTDTSGNYIFSGASAGLTYTVCETQPTGYGDGGVNPGGNGSSSAPNGITITNLPVSGSAANHFGELLGSLSGSVYVDQSPAAAANTNNGVRDAGESGIGGITITLSGRDLSGATVIRTTTTDANGNYSFSNLLQSDGAGYSVSEGAIPAAAGVFADGRDTAGSAGGSNAVNDVLSAIVLGAGVRATGYNFGELALAPISGTVYIDRDGNGQLGAADGRIAGVTLRLVMGTSCSGTVFATTTTDASGNYLFSGATAGLSYTVCETQPGGYVDGGVNPGANGSSSAANAISITNLPAAGSSGNHFGERAGSISGSVYVDHTAATPANTNNGVRDSGEAGIAGVVVTLTGRDVTGASVSRSTTTDASGNYRFDDLLQSDPAGYSVSEGAIPASAGSFNDGRDTVGSAGGNASVNDVLTTIVLGAGVQATGYNFGELPFASISGTVYIDRNRSNTLDATPTDGRIPGVSVRLGQGADCSTGTTLQTATTDAAGNYSFANVSVGADYLICEAQPAGYGNGAENPGSAGSTPGANVIRISNLPSAGSAGNHFGERVAALSGSVWLDANNDGTRQGAESGIAGVTVTLSGTDAAGNAVSRTATTDASGNYRFDDLLAAGAAGYTVTEQTAQPVVNNATTLNGRTVAGSTGGIATPVMGTPSTISGIALVAGAESTDNRFGELLPVSLSGTVFLDFNNNGLQNPPTDSGLPGVPLVISGTDDSGAPVVRNIVTATDGSYAVTDLRPGIYTVTEPTQPTGTTNGLTIPGSTGGTATPLATVPSAIAGIVLTTPGSASGANNFAEVPGNSAIEGRVWLDSSNNGLIDGIEKGIAGITVELTGADSTGRTIARSTVTDANGNYRFDGLAPGTYAVREPNQPPNTLNGITVPGTTGGSATGVATLPSAITGIALGLGVTSSANNFGEQLLSPDLRVSKSLVEAAITVGFPGHYRISVRNAGLAPTAGSYTVSDRLPAGVTLASVPTGSGWSCTGSAGASSFTCGSTEVLAAGATNANAITATVNAVASAAAASPVNNAVLVEGGGELEGAGPTGPERDAFNGNPGSLPVCSAAIDQNACRTPTPVQLPASLSGTVWQDGGTRPHLLDGGDTRLPGWLVEVINPATGLVVGTATTGSDGSYQVTGLQPGLPLVVRFRDPTSGIVFGYPVNGETAPGSSGANCDTTAAAGGKASSCVGSGATPWLQVVLAPGQNLPQQSLPVDPSGIVYDSGTRTPLPGSVVTLAPVGNCAGWNPVSGLVGATLGGYTVNGSAVSMTVGSNGYYQFLFGPNAPASCTFGLTVTPPSGYTFTSVAIPPTAGPLVPSGGTGSTYAVQPQAGAPTAAVGTGTTYFLTLNTGSGGANIIHNHIPLDPALPGAVALAKTADKAQAEVGDTLRYTITVSVPTGALPRQTTVVDRLPAGFTYIRGTAMVGTTPVADPQGGLGPTLAFNLGAMPASRQLVLHYRVRVGVGAAQGDGINRARSQSCGVPAGCVDAAFNPVPGSVGSNEGAFRVRVSGGVFTTDACVAGKIFVDCNNNHVQDREELGIPGVRLLMQDGTTLVSDSEGKYSACGLPPKSAVLKVDPLTLPRGSRLTTSSNRNLGDAGSLWLDLKNGELHRADFVEGSCSNTVLEQVKARRAQGEIRAPETEKKNSPALRFDSKAHGLSTTTTPQQGTDGANQQVPKPRPASGAQHSGGQP